VFNIQGSEMIFLLLVALIILGPEKLPDAIRKFGRAYSEFKKMANGFQGELRSALDEPMRELKDTADMMRNAVNFDDSPAPATSATNSSSADTEPAAAPPPVKREQGLNFGSANPRRSTDIDAVAAAAASTAATDDAVQRAPGLNFGSANPARPKPARDPLAAASVPAVEPAVEPAAADDIELPAPGEHEASPE
jgi:sec-independent protein translocase protein TatB